MFKKSGSRGLFKSVMKGRVKVLFVKQNDTHPSKEDRIYTERWGKGGGATVQGYTV